MTEKYIENLEKARKNLETADHLAYMTYQIVKEKKILLKVLEYLSQSVISVINAILQYEYLQKRVSLYKDARANFNTFKRLTNLYEITPEEVTALSQVLELARQHNNSPFEFIKNEKVVIMSKSLETKTITPELLKNLINHTKNTLKKANTHIPA